MLNRRYVLLKDLPTFKAGDEFFISEKGNLIAGTPEKPKKVLVVDEKFISPIKASLLAYTKEMLQQSPNILTEWFEEIDDFEYKDFFAVNGYGVYRIDFQSFSFDEKTKAEFRKIVERHKLLGNYFELEEEAEKHLEWLKARATLLRAVSKNGMFNVCQNSVEGFKVLRTADVWSEMMFATEEDARRSIRNHEKEWRIYLGVE